MFKLQKYIITFILLFGLQCLSAQQFKNSTQYLVNPYALTPALAGYTGYSEAFLNYRNDWTRIDGSPRTFSANGFGDVYKQKMWVGGEIMTDKTDILSVFKANISYTYKLQVENNQYLYFGVWTAYYQASVNVGGGIGIDPNDPLIQNNDKLNGSALNAGFGINYQRGYLNIGFSMPSMFGLNDEYVLNSSFKYRVQRQFQFYTSYFFEFNDEWQLQTYGVLYKTANEPVNMDISAMVIYSGRFWSGMLYRTGGVLALNLGGHIYNGFIFNYSYEIGTSGINQGSGGSHEITIGYRFKFTGDNYFESKESSKSRKKGRKSGTINYPEVQDFNYRKN
ncbi:MAG: PorP/SprF family type IX secretion system membrane protein [Bacteroidetes bacterium]|nr:PorP/SprF family type IX secretion system membrane protein [Bacteroidota bacterium]MBL6944461.1 PorP/SprF family type IX secretion system membrane protein [Bacteroidales bacterium]